MAWQVGSLDISRLNRKVPYLSTDALGEIAQTRPFHTVFPFLRHLRCSTVDLTPLFLNESLEELCMEMDYLSHYSNGDGRIIEAAVERICCYAPRLLRLRVRSKAVLWVFRQEMVPLFKVLKSLRVVVLPATLWPAAVWEALAMLPDLRVLHMERRCYLTLCVREIFQPSTWESSPVKLLPGAFPSLESFTGCFLSLQSSLRLLLHPHFPLSRLTCLDLEFTYGSGCEIVDLSSFMDSTAPYLDCLQTLRIRYTQLVNHSALSSLGEPEEEPALEFRVVSAFLSFRELTIFSIQHPFPIRMTEDDLETVAIHGHRFSEIWLNPSPRLPHLGRLPSLGCLIPFALHCDELTRLGLCMDCCSRPNCAPFDVKFPRLEELYVGSSLVPAHMPRMYRDWVEQARYLATILPDGCKVINDTCDRLTGMEFSGELEEELSFPGFRYFEAAWRTICGMIAVIHAVRRRMKMEEAVDDD